MQWYPGAALLFLVESNDIQGPVFFLLAGACGGLGLSLSLGLNLSLSLSLAASSLSLAFA